MRNDFRDYDPIGPGTPAWDYFDKAVEAWRAGRRKTYDNRRAAMIRELRREGSTIEVIVEWKESLRKALTDKERE